MNYPPIRSSLPLSLALISGSGNDRISRGVREDRRGIGDRRKAKEGRFDVEEKKEKPIATSVDAVVISARARTNRNRRTKPFSLSSFAPNRCAQAPEQVEASRGCHLAFKKKKDTPQTPKKASHLVKTSSHFFDQKKSFSARSPQNAAGSSMDFCHSLLYSSSDPTSALSERALGGG